MKKLSLLTCFGVAAILLVFSGDAAAQNAVFNGDFETGSYSPMWTLTGGNTYTQIAYFDTVKGQTSLCLKRRPGPPSSNGAIEQGVYLVKGMLYVFRSNVASQYCSS